jgi:hypothetical protein
MIHIARHGAGHLSTCDTGFGAPRADQSLLGSLGAGPSVILNAAKDLIAAGYERTFEVLAILRCAQDDKGNARSVK